MNNRLSKWLSRARWFALLGLGATGVNAALQHDYTSAEAEAVEPVAAAPLATSAQPSPKTVAFVTPRPEPAPTSADAIDESATGSGYRELAELLIEDLWQSTPAMPLTETQRFEVAGAFEWPTSFVSPKARVVSLAEQSGY